MGMKEQSRGWDRGIPDELAAGAGEGKSRRGREKTPGAEPRG